MNKWQRKCVASAILLLFIGPLFGLLQPISTNSGVTSPVAQGTIHSAYVEVGTTAALNALSDTILADTLIIDPTAIMTGGILSNFTLTGGNGFNVQNTSNYALEFSIIDSILITDLDGGFSMHGSPTITGTNLYIAGPLQSNSYPDAQIGSPTLTFNNVTASKIQFHVSGGTFIWNNSQTSSLHLNGFNTAILDSDNITMGLWVEGPDIVYIFNSEINDTIHESVKPTISCPAVINVPYSYVFQPQVQVEVDLGGSDNIRGPAYYLNYTLNLYKNGILQATIYNVLTDSCILPIDTTATYEIEFTCEDRQGNVSEVASITIIPAPDLLWFILMIIFIAAGAVGAIAVFYLWKQRQWQKTPLLEIPAQ